MATAAATTRTRTTARTTARGRRGATRETSSGGRAGSSRHEEPLLGGLRRYRGLPDRREPPAGTRRGLGARSRHAAVGFGQAQGGRRPPGRTDRCRRIRQEVGVRVLVMGGTRFV